MRSLLIILGCALVIAATVSLCTGEGFLLLLGLIAIGVVFEILVDGLIATIARLMPAKCADYTKRAYQVSAKEKKVYENVNDIMALGNDFGSGKFESIKAKIFLQRNGEVSKIIFYPKGAGKTEGSQVDSDYIQNCDEVIWEFSDINKTTLNYKNDLWEYL